MIVLGIDIGGSAIKAAPVLIETGGLADERLCIPTPQPATPSEILVIIDRILSHFQWKGPVGCGFPAVIQQGIIRTAANIDLTWIGTNIATLLANRTGLPFEIINDADAAGLAEISFGAGRGQPGTILMVTAGTGLGTALFRNAILLPNTELGHLQLNGQVAEHYASAEAKARMELSYRDWAQRFDTYLHCLEELLWPDLFIIGGEISKHHEEFFPYLTINSPIVPATLRNDAGIVGAALAAANNLYSSS